MVPPRPPTPRPSGGAASRSARPGARNTRPASGQVPANGSSSSRAVTPGGNRTGGASPNSSQPRGSAQNRGSAQGRNSAQPRNSAQARTTGQARTSEQGRDTAQARSSAQPQRDNAAPRANKKTTANSARPTAPATARRSAGNAESSKSNASTHTESVATYEINGSNVRNFGFFHNMTVRIVAVTFSCIVAAVVLAPVARNYIKQYNTNAGLKADIAAQQATNEELRNNLSRWEDRNYVIAQARERLTFVFPGETPYRVMGWDSGDLEEVAPKPETPELFPHQKAPWYEEMLNSIQKSGQLATGTPEKSTDATTKDSQESEADSGQTE